MPELRGGTVRLKLAPRMVGPRSLTKDAPGPGRPQARSALAGGGVCACRGWAYTHSGRADLPTAEGARHASKGGACVSWSDGQPSQVEEPRAEFPRRGRSGAVGQAGSRRVLRAVRRARAAHRRRQARRHRGLHERRAARLRRTAPNGATFELSAHVEPGALCVSVSDQGRGHRRAQPQPRPRTRPAPGPAAGRRRADPRGGRRARHAPEMRFALPSKAASGRRAVSAGTRGSPSRSAGRRPRRRAGCPAPGSRRRRRAAARGASGSRS